MRCGVGHSSPSQENFVPAGASITIHIRRPFTPLLDGFTPALRDSFTIVTAAGGLTGTFNDTLFPPLPIGQVWSLDYSRTAFVLSTIIGVLGDTNGALTVDLKDANRVRNNFGGSGIGIDGVTDDDGLVDLSDLNNARNNFGVSAAQAVPEPSANLLVAVDWMAVMFATVGCCRSASKAGLKGRMTL